MSEGMYSSDSIILASVLSCGCTEANVLGR